MTKTKVVIFDLDGTILKNRSSCELVANRLGTLSQMVAFENFRSEKDIIFARETMASWYKKYSNEELVSMLQGFELAEGTHRAFEILRSHNIKTAISSITWNFAVKYFAEMLSVDFWKSTELDENGQIDHFWPEDKAVFAKELSKTLGLTLDEVAGVGDSFGDIPLLKVCGTKIFVGESLPNELKKFNVGHYPKGNLEEIVQDLLLHN